MPTTSAAYPPEYFLRQDQTDDALFYQEPRLVVHIDDGAIAALGKLFTDILHPNGYYLDLMSSWRSHIPPELEPEHVVGVGLNNAEMEANPQLKSHHLVNLNNDPELPFHDEQFDGAMCTVSVQYLTKPLEVFTEVFRVLKPGCPFIVSFSNRCFPTKAIAAWTYSDSSEHIGLVNSYFTLSAKWTDMHARIKNTPNSDPLFMLWGFKPH